MANVKANKRHTWQRVARSLRLAAILVIIAVLGVVVYQLYDFYGNKVGYAPERAIERYVVALGDGNYDEVYRLTSRSSLVDLAGRPVSQTQYVAYLQALSRGQPRPLSIEKMTRLVETAGSRYYLVLFHPTAGGGQARMVIEVRREASGWMVANPFVFLP